MKSVQFCLFVTLIVMLLGSSSHARSLKNFKDMNDVSLTDENDLIDLLNKQLDETIKSYLDPKNSEIRYKRSDIDSRLMALQAKIDLIKAFKKLPAGHGKFDFEKIGKRFLREMDK